MSTPVLSELRGITPTDTDGLVTKSYVDGKNLVLVMGIQSQVVVQTYPARFALPVSWTMLGVSAFINTAPTGSSLIVGVLKNGTTIYGTNPGNRPTIAISGVSATETVPDTTAMAANDYLQVAPAQVGSTVPGSDLTVVIRYTVP